MKTAKIFVSLIAILLMLTQCSSFKDLKQDSGHINFKKEGFSSLFNGKDLTGWTIPEGDNGHWKVLDGVIDYDALSEAKDNKSLYSSQKFKDYKLHLEWRFKKYSGLYPMSIILPNGDYARDAAGKALHFMRPNSDSGILMRGKQQVQVWCWPIGSGEIWGTRLSKDVSPEERAKAVPNFHADNPVGEWNAFDITLKGNRVTVYLNNILVIEDALMVDLPKDGPIGLQHHGGMNSKTGKMDGASSLIQYRNIWIKEL
ncbi:MAG: 3-keto-disaccharide hydrolase [Daejeonella sp.]